MVKKRRQQYQIDYVCNLTSAFSDKRKKWGTFVRRFWARRHFKRWSLKNLGISIITLHTATLFKTVENQIHTLHRSTISLHIIKYHFSRHIQVNLHTLFPPGLLYNPTKLTNAEFTFEIIVGSTFTKSETLGFPL